MSRPSQMMLRVLFVDDEPQVLSALRRALHPLRECWAIEFALGGAAGITSIETHAIDVVVTDMRMPNLDGVAVLQAAATHLPGAGRVLLTGWGAQEQLARAHELAHRVLSKPCDVEQLRSTIEGVATVSL